MRDGSLTCRVADSFSLRHASLATTGCESPEDNAALMPQGIGRENREKFSTPAASQAGGVLRRTICATYVNCRVSAGSTTANVVNGNRPEMLTGLNQKVRGTDRAVRCCPAQPAIPPADRHAASSPSDHAEHGRATYFSSQ